MRVLGKINDERPRVDSGDTFPTNPKIGDIFEKIGDNNGPYYYSGTEWRLILTGSISSELGYTPLNKAGDSIGGSLSFPPTSGVGVKIDNTWGWRDITSEAVTRRTSGLGAPVLSTWIGNIKEYAYIATDLGDSKFHITHDYVPGSDMFIHMHWGHNGTNISGSLIVNFYVTYAKGHQQSTFHSTKTLTLTVPNLNITNTPKYLHRVDEIQMSIPGGSSSMLDTNILETDGMILVNYEFIQIPVITGSDFTNKPYCFGVDLHYQSTNLATKNKSPSFYD